MNLKNTQKLKTKTESQTSPLPYLTAKERSVMTFIEEYIEENNIAPSFQEICDQFGFASFNSVQNYMKQLTQKGYIQVFPHQKRAIKILQTVRENTKAKLSPENDPNSEAYIVPLLGGVAAGIPIEEMEHDEFIQIPRTWVKNQKSLFALKVKGTSMIEDGILSGDIIVVEQAISANNGSIVVATIDNESTVKRYFAKHGLKNLIELRPANSELKSQWYPPDQVQIRGVVVGLMRHF